MNAHIERHPAVVHELVSRVGSQQALDLDNDTRAAVVQLLAHLSGHRTF